MEKNKYSTNHIPFNHTLLKQTIIQFKINKYSKFSCNIVLNKHKIYDIYFLSDDLMMIFLLLKILVIL